jgi:hypothetical protein
MGQKSKFGRPFRASGRGHLKILFESPHGQIGLYSVATQHPNPLATNPVFHSAGDFRLDDWTLPDWMIVLLLTITSAWLLLTKRRKKPVKESS